MIVARHAQEPMLNFALLFALLNVNVMMQNLDVQTDLSAD
jgi:hypothetical protein